MRPLDLSKSFNKFTEIIIKDTIDGIKNGVQFGHPFKPNERSTKDQKGHNLPLIGKDRSGAWLKKGKYKVEKATATKQRATVEIPESEIALINQTSKTHARPFWGVSKSALKSMDNSVNYDIRKYLKKSIDDPLLKAGFKKV